MLGGLLLDTEAPVMTPSGIDYLCLRVRVFCVLFGLECQVTPLMASKHADSAVHLFRICMLQC